MPSTPMDLERARTDPAELAERKLSRGAILFAAGAVGVLIVYLLWQATRLGGNSHTALIGDSFFIPADLLAIWATAMAARHCQADRRRCRSWAFVSVAMVGFLVGNAIQLYQEGWRHLPDRPDWSDSVFYVFFLIGLVGFSATRRNMVRRWLFTLDTTTIALGAGAVLWYFVAGPQATSHGHSLHEVFYAIVYPLGDLILLVAAVRTLQHGVPSSSLRAIRTLSVGIFVYVVADTMEGYLGLHGGYHGGDRVDIVGMAATTLLALAGALQPTVGEGEPDGRPSRRTGSGAISYVAATAVFGLVFFTERDDPFFPNLSILVVAVVIVVLVGLGQVLSRRALLGEQAINEDLFGELRHQAFHDGLTGLANRALFGERLEHALERRRTFSMSHAVLMIDLDEFKLVNDTLGHEAGDEVLRSVATRLRNAVRVGDTVARVGGDEFAILLEDVNGERAAIELVEHLLHVVGKPITVSGRTLVQRASVGIAITDDEPHTAEELLRYADTAMYRAKRQISDHYCVFETSMQTALVDRAELEVDLRCAVERGELRVFYQPILDLSSEGITGFEALVRWMHPSRGLLPPTTFIPLAEQGGLIHEIDTWVLYEACAEASRWQHQSPQFAEVSVHVNLSPLQLRESDLVDTITGALSAARLESRFLTLELVESSVVEDLELAQARLTELKALGLRIAVDDFGTGYSSLSHLRTLPIDELKIDRSFIAEMGTSAQASALVHSLIQLGAALGMDTVAEGIEDAVQLLHLRGEGCLQGQGYLFARPLYGEELHSYILEHTVPPSGRYPSASHLVVDGKA